MLQANNVVTSESALSDGDIAGDLVLFVNFGHSFLPL